MFRSTNEVRGWSRKVISSTQLESLVSTGEILHAKLHRLSKEEREGYLPHFNLLLSLIERGKKDNPRNSA